MSGEDNKAVVRRYYEDVLNGGNTDALGMDVYVVKNAQLAEHWDVVDLMPFLQAIGAILSPAQSEDQSMAG